MNENVIEFLRDQKQATVTFSQGRFINRIRALAKEKPDECKITAENTDGSIVAHIPTSWIRIAPPRIVKISDERKEELRERFLNMKRKESNTNE